MYYIWTGWLILKLCQSINKEEDEQNIKIILGRVM